MSDKWPRRLVPQSEYYLVHKVGRAAIRDDDLRLSYDDGSGRTYAGPVYPQYLIGHRRLVAARILAENDVPHVAAIKYLVARHSGSSPRGCPVRLLSGDENLRDLAVRSTRVSADAIGMVIDAFKKDEALLQAVEDDADPPLVAGAIVGWRAWEVWCEARLTLPSIPEPSPLGVGARAVLVSYVVRSPLDWDRRPFEWTAGRMEAQCVRALAESRGHSEPSPAVPCSCGLYGFTRLDDCVACVLDHLIGRQQGARPVVIGRVAGWGKVVEHEDGFRAQYARALPPFLVGAENLHLATPLARISIGPVMGVERDEWTAPGLEARAMRFPDER